MKTFRQTASSRSASQKYVFVDNVRFWSMLSIVAVHCAGGFFGAVGIGSEQFLVALEDCLKFGSIAFFLVSGFLLGSRLELTSRTSYFGRRINRVFLPWLVWFGVQVCYYTVGRVMMHGEHLGFDLRGLHLVGVVTRACLFATAFWFVPNLLLALGTLLLFRNFLANIWFGLVLMAITFFYAINIYGRWVPPGHTMALFGFVFYLWLGYSASRNYEKVTAFVARVPTFLLCLITLGLMFSCFAETRLLTTLHSLDPTNSIRVTNQLYSVAVVLLLMKFRGVGTPWFVDVRKNIFGIYLSFTLVLSIVETLLKRMTAFVPVMRHLHGNLYFLLVWLTGSLLVFSACLLISKLYGSLPALAWSVGGSAEDTKAPSAKKRAEFSPPHAISSSLSAKAFK